MLWPVEFDASGNPRPQQPYQCGLDDRLPIKEVVLIGLVQTGMNPAPNLGKDHELYVLVLKHDRPVSPVSFFQRDLVCEWVGIDFSAASLVHTLFKKHRIWVCFLC